MKRHLYDYQETFERALRLVQTAPMHEGNRAEMLRFIDHVQAQGLSLPRIIRYTIVLRQAERLLNKLFKEASQDDIVRVVAGMERQGYSEATKANFKVIIKRFYKWLLGNESEYPALVRWLKGNIPRDRQTTPQQSELVNEEEVRLLITKADNPRDKAFIALLWDSGGRIGEIGTPVVNDVTFDRYGGKIHVNGKTGPRHVRFIQATPYVANWLSQHPQREDKNAPLWISTSNSNRGAPLGWAAFRKVLRVTFAKAGIKKKSNPHSFRHARATNLANHLTEHQLSSHFGWIPGSRMPATYVHLSGRDTDAALLKLNGIAIDEPTNTTEGLKPLVCPRCDTLNTRDGKFCRKCGTALDLNTALGAEQKTREAEGLLAEVLKDELVQHAIQGAMLKLRLKKETPLTQVKAPASFALEPESEPARPGIVPPPRL
jgi:integrase/ribosomal protein L40E